MLNGVGITDLQTDIHDLFLYKCLFISAFRQVFFVRSFFITSDRPFVYSLDRSLDRSFVRSFVRLFVRSYIRSFVRSVGRSFVRCSSFIHSDRDILCRVGEQ